MWSPLSFKTWLRPWMMLKLIYRHVSENDHFEMQVEMQDG